MPRFQSKTTNSVFKRVGQALVFFEIINISNEKQDSEY